MPSQRSRRAPDNAPQPLTIIAATDAAALAALTVLTCTRAEFDETIGERPAGTFLVVEGVPVAVASQRVWTFGAAAAPGSAPPAPVEKRPRRTNAQIVEGVAAARVRFDDEALKTGDLTCPYRKASPEGRAWAKWIEEHLRASAGGAA